MKVYLQAAFLAIAVFVASSLYAQTSDMSSEPAVIEEKPKKEVKSEPVKQAERNMEKAAESIQRSAEKIKVVIEDKADRLAKTSQPAIESFLVASSNLIEKIAIELENLLNEKQPVKRSSE